MVEDDSTARAGESLDELNALRVVFPLDFLIVGKRLVLRLFFEELEARKIKRHRVLLATDVLYLNLTGHINPVLCTDTGDRIGVNVDIWPGAIGRTSEVVELGSDSVDGHLV